MKKIYLLAMSIALFSMNAIFAQSGFPDPTFGNNGKLELTWNPAGWSIATTILAQPDGKFLLGGVVVWSNNDNDFAIQRLLSNGTPDNSFGNSGLVTLSLGSDDDWIADMALQPDGKIVAVGRSRETGTQKPLLVLTRFNADGSLDNTFGNQGISRTVVQQGDHASRILLQPDGKFLVSSNFSSNTGFGFFRFNTDGTLDASFGQAGRVVKNLGYFQSQIRSIALKPDGKFLVSGYSNTSMTGNVYLYFILQYQPDGSIDASFGTNGVLHDHFLANGTYSIAETVLSLGAGKILVAGSELDPATSNSLHGLAQYLPDGTPDPAFGVAGKKTISIPDRSSGAGKLLLQADGKLITLGTTFKTDFSEPFGYATARLNPDGSPDNSYGINGVSYGIFKDTANIGSLWDATLLPDGKILSTMALDYWDLPGAPIGVIRILNDLNTGVLDFSTMDKSLMVYPNPLAQDATLEFVLDKAAQLSVSLYDLKGNTLQTFIANTHFDAGSHAIPISLDNHLPSGNYIISLTSSDKHVGIKVVK